jgi:hypothetical protein
MIPKINILVDVGEAYDRLSILEIKKEKLGIEKQFDLINQINILQEQISHSIGRDLACDIFESEEYKELKNMNRVIFLSIDDLRKENDKGEYKDPQELGIIGVEIDVLNTKRFKAKNNLQKKFFNKETEEIKN